MKQVLSAHDVVRMKAQTTPHNNVTLLHKQALDWTPNSSCRWQAQACLNMLQRAHYERMDISLSSGIHVILTHCNLNFYFWPGFDAFWPTVHGWGYPQLYPVTQEGPTGSGTKQALNRSSFLSKNAVTNQPELRAQVDKSFNQSCCVTFVERVRNPIPRFN
jgi:hypothetical protein